MANWTQQTEDDAKDAIAYLIDEIVESLVESPEEASTYIQDYSDEYHFSSHVDRPYSLLEAAELLDQLDEYEETDSGLWEGQEPRRAIETQAAFTYGNAVAGEFSELMENIKNDVENQIDWDAEAEREYETEAEEKAARKNLAQQISDIIYQNIEREPPAPPPPPPHRRGTRGWRPE